MKKMTIWQRLNTALILLIILLLVGVGLVLWVEESRSSARTQADQLSAFRDRAALDITILGDSLRGVLLDGKIDADRKRRISAEEELKRQMDEIQEAFANHSDLVGSVKTLRDFVVGTLTTFQNRVLEMSEGDLTGATAYYQKNWPAVNQQRQQVLTDLAQKIEAVATAEALKAKTISIIGVGGIVLILLAALLIGRLQSEAVTEPLNRLVSTLDRMRQGDFTQRLDLERNDEFGVLSHGLNRLAEELSELVGQVQRSGLQVNTTAGHIAVTAKEQQATAHEIAATTAEIGTASKEITTTSQQLVRTMNEVSQVAEQTARLAEGGRLALASMENIMKQILDSSGSISAKLSVLSEKTTNINSVVTTITKVADQTNLLSLNAAIEAEKAGEYGLGFAVVAMEIRRLADQTAVATYDIEKMVKEMQTAVAAGVMGMDKFSDEVKRGTEQVRTAGQHLGEILQQVQALTPRFQTVNAGMNAQANEAQQISETLIQLGEAARQTADSLRRSNQAIEELNLAANLLQTSVARFRLTS